MSFELKFKYCFTDWASSGFFFFSMKIIYEKSTTLSDTHPPHSSPAKIEGVFGYSPCLFGKRIVVHAKQTCKQQTSHLLKQNLSETITPIYNSCMLSFNPSINPVVC